LDSDLEAAILADSSLLLDRALSDDSFSLIELALLILAFLFDASFAELFFRFRKPSHVHKNLTQNYSINRNNNLKNS